MYPEKNYKKNYLHSKWRTKYVDTMGNIFKNELMSVKCICFIKNSLINNHRILCSPQIWVPWYILEDFCNLCSLSVFGCRHCWSLHSVRIYFSLLLSLKLTWSPWCTTSSYMAKILKGTPARETGKLFTVPTPYPLNRLLIPSLLMYLCQSLP